MGNSLSQLLSLFLVFTVDKQCPTSFDFEEGFLSDPPQNLFHFGCAVLFKFLKFILVSGVFDLFRCYVQFNFWLRFNLRY